MQVASRHVVERTECSWNGFLEPTTQRVPRESFDANKDKADTTDNQHQSTGLNELFDIFLTNPMTREAESVGRPSSDCQSEGRLCFSPSAKKTASDWFPFIMQWRAAKTLERGSPETRDLFVMTKTGGWHSGSQLHGNKAIDAQARSVFPAYDVK